MPDCHAHPDQPFPAASKAFLNPNRVVCDVSEEAGLMAVTPQRVTESGANMLATAQVLGSRSSIGPTKDENTNSPFKREAVKEFNLGSSP